MLQGFKRALIWIALAVGTIVAVGAFGGFDAANNFAPAKATVTAVERLCFLRRSAGRTTQHTRPQPCVDARRRIATEPLFADADLIDVSRVNVTYEDHQGLPQTGGFRLPAAWIDAPPAVGQQIGILLHKTDARRIRSGQPF